MSDEAIVLQDLTKCYGPIKAVNGISLTIPRGTICGLLGPNGAGKTTTFRMLCGYLQPTSGSITIFGQKPGAEELLHGRVLALPQDAVLPPHTTVRNFLLYLGKLQGLSGNKLNDEVARVLDIVAMKEAAGQIGKSMSHGMARRVALASAILGSPELIMLDEPTGGLDPRNALAVRKLIKNLHGKATVVVASHNLAEVQDICTHVAIIGKGELSAFGTVAEICRKSQHFTITLDQENIDTAKLQVAVPQLKLTWLGKEQQLLVEIPAEDSTRINELTRKLLTALIAQDANITALSRGESLEKRFLELT